MKLRLKSKSTNIVYQDIHRDFLPQLKNDVQVVTNQKAIEQSITGIVSTNKGECPLDPEFGCNIGNQLFENINAGQGYAIEQSVIEAIMKYEPRVENVRVVCYPVPDQNMVIVTISYDIKRVNEQQTLTYEFSGI